MRKPNSILGFITKYVSKKQAIWANRIFCLSILVLTYFLHLDFYNSEVANQKLLNDELSQQLSSTATKSISNYLNHTMKVSKLLTSMVSDLQYDAVPTSIQATKQKILSQLTLADADIVAFASFDGELTAVNSRFERFRAKLPDILGRYSHAAALEEGGGTWAIIFDPDNPERQIRLLVLTSFSLSNEQQAMMVSAFEPAVRVNSELVAYSNKVYVINSDSVGIALLKDQREMIRLDFGESVNTPAASKYWGLDFNELSFEKKYQHNIAFWQSEQFPGEQYFRHSRQVGQSGWQVVVLLEISSSLSQIEDEYERGLFAYLLVFILFVYFERSLTLHYRIVDMTYKDPLTGLYNRNHLHVYGPDMWTLQDRGKVKSIGVMALDIDHFKRVNDTFGHQVGDQALVAVANICRQTSRKNDKIYRLGGEEFAILTVGEELPGMLTMAERLRANVENSHEVRTFLPDGLTISIGLAMRNKNEDENELFKRADELLYQAKGNGRNRVEY